MYVTKGQPRYTGKGSGWQVFAATMMLLSAATSAVWGIYGIANNAYWGGDNAVSGHHLLFGWLWIGLALFQLVAAMFIVAVPPFGAVLGIFLAGVSGIGHLVMSGRHPVWSVIVIGLDGLVVYALARHSFES